MKLFNAANGSLRFKTINGSAATPELISELPDWLKTAEVETAEVDVLQDGQVTWKNGTWKDGTWLNGTWKNGTWIKGTWMNGTWNNGAWNSGTWEDGVWLNGVWNDGTWKNGTWFSGIRWKKQEHVNSASCKNYNLRPTHIPVVFIPTPWVPIVVTILATLLLILILKN